MKKLLLSFKSIGILIIAFHLCVLSAFSQENQSKIRKDINEKIKILNKDMEKAFNDNDMVKVAAFYRDDAEISGEYYTVKGRKSLDNYWMNLKDKGRGWKLDVIEIGGEGELVYQLGKSDLRYISKGVEKRSITNFILIWKLSTDGTYTILRDYLTDIEFIKPGKK
jgi:ketosteroid isomerase-like protein